MNQPYYFGQCEICRKHKGGATNHQKCSRILQKIKLGENEKNPKKLRKD